MTRRYDRWAKTTRQAHGAPCVKGCGAPTYAKSGVCVECRRQARTRSYVDPRTMPDSYLETCARELLRRHEARAQLLTKLKLVPDREAAAA